MIYNITFDINSWRKFLKNHYNECSGEIEMNIVHMDNGVILQVDDTEEIEIDIIIEE